MTRKLIPFEVPQVTHGLPAQIWIENDVERQSPQEIIIVSLTARIAALEADNAQLREAMGKAGIALRFYEDWMKTHEDGTRYPYGIETEQMISVLAGAR